ncbi:MAG: DNA repair protein, partial [Paraglaciecola sp.]
IQLEELESKFSEYDQFLSDIMDKREELHSVFESRKQSLLEDQQRRSQNLFGAAERILKGVARRAYSFGDADQLNTYFASDPMVMKIADLVAQLRELNDPVKADDLEAQLKAAKEQGIRSLRDKQDIFEDGGAVIKLGKHKFSVNSQNLDLTLLPRDDGLYRHLVGTDYFEQLDNQELNELKPYWQQALVSENQQVSRIEYLTSLIIRDAEQQQNGQSINALYKLADDPKALLELVRQYIAARYQEGYEKGVHDSDTVKVLQAILPVHQKADLLRFAPKARGLAMMFWAFSSRDKNQEKIWQSHAFSAQLLANSFNSLKGFEQLQQSLLQRLQGFCEQFGLTFSYNEIQQSTEYLSAELAHNKLAFISSQPAKSLSESFTKQLDAL